MKHCLGLFISVALLPATLAGQSSSATTKESSRPAWLATEDGKPIDTRPTEKKDNTPAFPEQTRAPYRKTAPFKITTLIDNLEVPWSLAFLPSGNIILTERLPGRLRIYNKDGSVSKPLTGVSAAMSAGAKDI